jgi:hypothetical protein
MDEWIYTEIERLRSLRVPGGIRIEVPAVSKPLKKGRC